MTIGWNYQVETTAKSNQSQWLKEACIVDVFTSLAILDKDRSTNQSLQTSNVTTEQFKQISEA